MTREAVNDVVAKGIVGLTRELPEDMGLVLVGIDTEGNTAMRATLNLSRSTLGQIFNQLAQTAETRQSESNVPFQGDPLPEQQPCSCARCREARQAAN